MDDQQEAVEEETSREAGTSTHVFNDIHVWRSRIPYRKERWNYLGGFGFDRILGGRLNIYMAFTIGTNCIALKIVINLIVSSPLCAPFRELCRLHSCCLYPLSNPPPPLVCARTISSDVSRENININVKLLKLAEAELGRAVLAQPGILLLRANIVGSDT